MNWHAIIDERSYELDATVADELTRDPAKLDLVVEWITRFLNRPGYSEDSKQALREWLQIIRRGGIAEVVQKLRDRSEDAVRLRQNSPFGVVMPQEKRRKIFEKYEALRTGTHSSSV